MRSQIRSEKLKHDLRKMIERMDAVLLAWLVAKLYLSFDVTPTTTGATNHAVHPTTITQRCVPEEEA